MYVRMCLFWTDVTLWKWFFLPPQFLRVDMSLGLRANCFNLLVHLESLFRYYYQTYAMERRPGATSSWKAAQHRGPFRDPVVEKDRVRAPNSICRTSPSQRLSWSLEIVLLGLEGVHLCPGIEGRRQPCMTSIGICFTRK